MNIFSFLIKNLRMRPVTLRLPEEVPYPKDFRGPVKMQGEKCIGCGLCAYVCVSAAIRVIEHEDHCEWTYAPGRCTFCAQCVNVCSGQALLMESLSTPSYFRAQALDEVHRVPYPPCPECGRPTPPAREAVLARAFKEVTPEVRARSQLCARCRRKASQRELVSMAKR